MLNRVPLASSCFRTRRCHHLCCPSLLALLLCRLQFAAASHVVVYDPSTTNKVSDAGPHTAPIITGAGAVAWPFGVAVNHAGPANPAPVSRGHLITSTMSTCFNPANGIVANRNPRSCAQSTFVHFNTVPVYQPFDGHVWANREAEVLELLDSAWAHPVAGLDVKFYYTAGPANARAGLVANSRHGRIKHGAAVVPAPAANAYAGVDMTAWPAWLWGVLVIDIHMTPAGGAVAPVGVVPRWASIAWRCDVTRDINSGAMTQPVGNAPCRYISISALRQALAFDPVPGLPFVNAARNNADWAAMLPTAAVPRRLSPSATASTSTRTPAATSSGRKSSRCMPHASPADGRLC